jgi:hypothetical protein
MKIKDLYKKFSELKTLAPLGLEYLDGASHELHVKDKETGIEFDVKNISLVHEDGEEQKGTVEDYTMENCYVVKGKKKVMIFQDQDEVTNYDFLEYLAVTFYESKEYKDLISKYDAARSEKKNFEDKYGVKLYFDACLPNPVIICSNDEEYDGPPLYEMNPEEEIVEDATENYKNWSKQRIENLEEKKKEIDGLIKSMKVAKI